MPGCVQPLLNSHAVILALSYSPSNFDVLCFLLRWTPAKQRSSSNSPPFCQQWRVVTNVQNILHLLSSDVIEKKKLFQTLLLNAPKCFFYQYFYLLFFFFSIFLMKVVLAVGKYELGFPHFYPVVSQTCNKTLQFIGTKFCLQLSPCVENVCICASLDKATLLQCRLWQVLLWGMHLFWPCKC